MKRYINLLVYVIYRYYKDGGKRQEVAFLTTKLVLGICLFANIFTILYCFHFNIAAIIGDGNNPATQFFIALFFIVIPIYIIMSMLFKEEKIQKLEYSESTKKIASVFVVCYIVLTFILFLALVRYFHKAN